MPETSSTSTTSSRGIALLITGLPAAGKTTLGRALADHFEDKLGRRVSLFDGDEIRKLLSSELGFSREHRRLNVLRQGFLATEICRHGGIAICTLIAPYEADRAEMRQLVARNGSFIEVYLSTPLTECERRDPKGLYARARSGNLQHMTGIDDPYEPPSRPELKLDSTRMTIEQLVERVIGYLTERGLLARG